MRNPTQVPTQYGDPFFDLIGTEVTFSGEIISTGGRVMHEKGSKAVIEDVLFTPAHSYRPIPDIWVKAKINVIKLSGIYGHWLPDAFVEFKDPKNLER
jgi:hypothetical protein